MYPWRIVWYTRVHCCLWLEVHCHLFSYVLYIYYIFIQSIKQPHGRHDCVLVLKVPFAWQMVSHVQFLRGLWGGRPLCPPATGGCYVIVIWWGASSISMRKVSMGVSPMSLKKKQMLQTLQSNGTQGRSRRKQLSKPAHKNTQSNAEKKTQDGCTIKLIAHLSVLDSTLTTFEVRKDLRSMKLFFKKIYFWSYLNIYHPGPAGKWFLYLQVVQGTSVCSRLPERHRPSLSAPPPHLGLTGLWSLK